MTYINSNDFVRAMHPYSDLKDPTNTIYDHLPYKKDINLVKESDVRMVSGNVVKYMQLVSDEPVTVDTNPLAGSLIENASAARAAELTRKNEEALVVAEIDDANIVEAEDEFTPEPVPVVPEESLSSFASEYNEDDDYSFLHE